MSKALRAMDWRRIFLVRLPELVLFFLFILLVAAMATRKDTAFNGPFLMLKQFFKTAEWGFPNKLGWIEGYFYQERYYIAYPPMVTLSLIPSFLLGGFALGQIGIFGVFSALNALFFYAWTRVYFASRIYAVWAVMAFALGTPFLNGLGDGNVWTLMHLQSCLFLNAAFFCLVRQRYFWSGFLWMVAVQCRYVAFFAIWVLAVLPWVVTPRVAGLKDWLKKMTAVGLGAVWPLLVVLVAQKLWTGSFFLSPYEVAWRQWGIQVTSHFDWSYVATNIRVYFQSPPRFLPDFPYVKFPFMGTSFWMLSPFVVLAFLIFFRWFLGLFQRNLTWDDFKDGLLFMPPVVAMLWFYLLYRYFGVTQLGCRYMLDLMPLLIPLAIAGVRWAALSGLRIFQFLVLMSVVINVLAVISLRLVGA